MWQQAGRFFEASRGKNSSVSPWFSFQFWSILQVWQQWGGCCDGAQAQAANCLVQVSFGFSPVWQIIVL